MRILPLAMLLLVLWIIAACDSPSPAFRGVPAQEVTVQGSRFSVRLREDRAEAIRLSREWRPARDVILARGQVAIARASGCAVRDVAGDQAIVTARLDC